MPRAANHNELLPTQVREIVDDIIPRLERVGPEFKESGHGVALLFSAYQVVAIEQVAPVGVDGVAPGRYVDMLFEP